MPNPTVQSLETINGELEILIVRFLREGAGLSYGKLPRRIEELEKRRDEMIAEMGDGYDEEGEMQCHG